MSLYLGPTPPTTSSQVSCPITLRLWLVFSSADFHTPTPFIYNSNKHVKIAIHSLYVQIKFLLSKLLSRYMLSQMSYNSLRAGAKCLTRVPLSRTRAQCKARSGCTCADYIQYWVSACVLYEQNKQTNKQTTLNEELCNYVKEALIFIGPTGS